MVTFLRRARLVLGLYARIITGRAGGLEDEIRQVRRQIGRDCRICGRVKPWNGPCDYCPPEWQRRAS